MSRKLLLVDDNHLTVESILYSIDWAALDIGAPLTAYDGSTALQLMRDELPDLIISDITMPGLSGLELAEQARRICPACKIILISAYDKFEYAQNAVRFGVYDYVEKPLDYDYLSTVIQKALEALDTEETNRELLKKSFPALEEQFIRSLLYSSGSPALDSVNQYTEYFRIPADCSCFIVLHVQPEDSDSLRKQYGLEQYHLYFMQIEEQLRGAFREFRLSYVLRELDGFICVLGASDTSANKFRLSVIEAAKHIADQYQNCFPILIGLGSVVGQIGNLQTSLLQSRRAIYSHFFFPDQAVLEEVNADAVGTNLLSHKEANEEALLQLIGRNDMDGISRWIREFLETFPADPDYQYLVYTALFSLTARLQKFCYEMNLSTESFEPELLTIIQHPDQLQNIHQISEWLTNICRRICDNLQSSVKSYHQMLCDSAISYIKKHYSDQDLNLNQIADHIQITPTYLSSLFKKYKQQNISTYITNIRIEKACVLLKTTSSSLKEISAMVGYSNQYYFSSCFKKIVGVNPSAYR